MKIHLKCNCGAEFSGECSETETMSFRLYMEHFTAIHGQCKVGADANKENLKAMYDDLRDVAGKMWKAIKQIQQGLDPNWIGETYLLQIEQRLQGLGIVGDDRNLNDNQKVCTAMEDK